MILSAKSWGEYCGTTPDNKKSYPWHSCMKPFLQKINLKSMFWRLLPLDFLIDRAHEGAQIFPEQNRESSPLSKDILWCFCTDDSVGRILGGAAKPLQTPRKPIHDIHVWSTCLPQINLKSMFWGLWIRRCRMLFVVAPRFFQALYMEVLKIAQKKTSREFPPWGVSARTTSDTRKLILDFPASTTFRPKLNIKSMFWSMWIRLCGVLFVVVVAGSILGRVHGLLIKGFEKIVGVPPCKKEQWQRGADTKNQQSAHKRRPNCNRQSQGHTRMPEWNWKNMVAKSERWWKNHFRHQFKDLLAPALLSCVNHSPCAAESQKHM